MPPLKSALPPPEGLPMAYVRERARREAWRILRIQIYIYIYMYIYISKYIYIHYVDKADVRERARKD